MASPPEYVYSAVAQQDSVVYINDVKDAQLELSCPKNIMLPRLSGQLLEQFQNLGQKLHQSLTKLSKQRRRGLDNFLQDALYKDIPDDKQPEIPPQTDALFDHLQKYWNSFCVDLLMLLADHLHDVAPEFKEMVNNYQQVSLQSKDVRLDTHTQLKQLQGYTRLIVRMNRSTQETAAKAHDIQQFWAGKLKDMGSRLGMPILLAGLIANTCDQGTNLVFFVSERYIIKLFGWAQHNKGVIYGHGMETFTVPDVVTLNTGTGNTVHIQNEPPELRILVIGETGSGKSTLINNLLGKNIVNTGDRLVADTPDIIQCQATVRGVPIVLYDTPGSGDIHNCTYADKRKLQRKIKAVITRNKPALIVFCIQMHSTRYRNSHVNTLQFYDEVGIKWDNTVIALTFADIVPIPKEKRNRADSSQHFTEKRDEWQQVIQDALTTKVGVPQKVAKKVMAFPTTDDTEMKLPNGEEWFMPLFMNILKVLPPTASFRFVDVNSEAIKGDKSNIMEIHQGVLEILKEKVEHFLLEGLCLGGASANIPALLGLGAIAGGITALVLVNSAGIAGALSCGAGGIIIVVAVGIAVVVMGSVVAVAYHNSQAATDGTVADD